MDLAGVSLVAGQMERPDREFADERKREHAARNFLDAGDCLV